MTPETLIGSMRDHAVLGLASIMVDNPRSAGVLRGAGTCRNPPIWRLHDPGEPVDRPPQAIHQ